MWTEFNAYEPIKGNILEFNINIKYNLHAFLTHLSRT